MAFGWAYVDCGTSGGGQAAGPTGSLQFLTGANATSGSFNLVYYTSSYGAHAANTLVLTGTLVVTGAISASSYYIKNIAEVNVSGSTFFGNTIDDLHERTGSLKVGAGGVHESTLWVRSDSSVAGRQVHVRGLNVAYTPVLTSPYTSSEGDYIIGVRVTGDCAIQIPRASSRMSGAVLLIKDEVGHTDGTDITISADAPATIDGASNYVLTGSNPAISLYSNGANWFVF